MPNLFSNEIKAGQINREYTIGILNQEGRISKEVIEDVLRG